MFCTRGAQTQSSQSCIRHHLRGLAVTAGWRTTACIVAAGPQAQSLAVAAPPAIVVLLRTKVPPALIAARCTSSPALPSSPIDKQPPAGATTLVILAPLIGSNDLTPVLDYLTLVLQHPLWSKLPQDQTNIRLVRLFWLFRVLRPIRLCRRVRPPPFSALCPCLFRNNRSCLWTFRTL